MHRLRITGTHLAALGGVAGAALAFGDASQINKIFTEQESIKKLRHKNIISYLSTFMMNKQMVNIMDCCTGGELLDETQITPFGAELLGLEGAVKSALGFSTPGSSTTLT